MKRHVLIVLVLLTAPLSGPVHAEDVTARSLADMTVEERVVMMKAASKYDNCIYSQAISRVGEFPDIRQAADFAMGECQAKLADLEGVIVAMGFGPDYANAFAKRIRSRAARKILPELAIRKGGG